MPTVAGGATAPLAFWTNWWVSGCLDHTVVLAHCIPGHFLPVTSGPTLAVVPGAVAPYT